MFLLILIFLIILIVFYLRYIYTYWERTDFPHLKSEFPFGNLKKVAKRQISFGLSIYDLYLQTKRPFIGVYLFFRPALLIRDSNLVKNILVENFSSFHDRGIYCNEKDDPLSATLLALPGAKWKSLRTKLTPTFSSGKLKGMFTTILDVGNNLNRYVMKFIKENNDVINVKDISQRYTVAVIASVIFGIEVNTIDEPDHPFNKIAKMLNNPSRLQTLKLASTFLCPKVLEFLKVKWLRGSIEDFMRNIVESTIKNREENKIIRKDFMQMLLQLRNTGEIKDDENWNLKSSGENMKMLTIDQMAAQVFIFYIAGFETSSSTISYCLYELTQNPDIMKNLQNEINDTLKENEGNITYEMINEMKYLEMCLNETLRKYPSLPVLNRECTKDFTIPQTNYLIKKGTGIVISLYGIHHDEEYFKDPEKFDPERFSDENKLLTMKNYFPFGDGPRNCIGYRLGKLVAKIALVILLSNYNFEALDNKKLEFDPAPVTLIAKGGINLKISPRNMS